MIRFWIMFLIMTGIAVAILLFSYSASRRWPKWIAGTWFVFVFLTLMLIVAKAARILL